MANSGEQELNCTDSCSNGYSVCETTKSNHKMRYGKKLPFIGDFSPGICTRSFMLPP